LRTSFNGYQQRARTAAVALAGVAATLALGAAVFVAPAPARAAQSFTYTEGTGGGDFSIAGAPSQAAVVTVGSDRQVRLQRVMVSQWLAPRINDMLRSVYPMSDGGTVIAAGYGGVLVLSKPNEQNVRRLVRTYNPPAMRGVDQVAFSAVPLPNGNILVADRGGVQDPGGPELGGGVVYEVAPDDTYTLIYGNPDHTPGITGDGLTFPFCATRTDSGTTLICDAGNGAQGGNGSFRVIEVDPTRPVGHKIVWSYTEGRPTNEGHGVAAPRWAEKIGDKVIIADAGRTEGNTHYPGRVFEVDYNDPNIIDWSYTFGDKFQPSEIRRLDNGHFLVSDTGGGGTDVQVSGRVIEIDTAGHIVDEYGGSTPLDAPGTQMKDPRGAYRTPSGTTIIADNTIYNDSTGGQHRRLLEAAYAKKGSFTSPDLDMGFPGAPKRFTGVSFKSSNQNGTNVTVEYSVDGEQFKPASGAIDIMGVNIRYRVALTTTDRAVTPSLNEVSITYEPLTYTPDPGGTGNDPPGGSGPSGPGGNGTNPGGGSGGSGGSGSGGNGGSNGSGSGGTTHANSTQTNAGGQTTVKPGSGGQVQSSSNTDAQNNGPAPGSGKAITGFVMKESGGPSGGSGGSSGSDDPASPNSGSASAKFAVGMLAVAIFFASGIASTPLRKLTNRLVPMAMALLTILARL
jgi:hypothetical protein